VSAGAAQPSRDGRRQQSEIRRVGWGLFNISNREHRGHREKQQGSVHSVCSVA